MVEINAGLEKRFLNLLFKHRECLDKSIDKIQPDMFIIDKSYWLYKKLEEYYIKYLALPSKGIVKSFVNEFDTDSILKNEYFIFIKSVWLDEADKSEYDYLYDILKKRLYHKRLQ